MQVHHPLRKKLQGTTDLDNRDLSSKPNRLSVILLLELATFPYIQTGVLHVVVTSCSCWIVYCPAAPYMNNTKNVEEVASIANLLDCSTAHGSSVVL
jgi:hypothetical protein